MGAVFCRYFWSSCRASYLFPWGKANAGFCGILSRKRGMVIPACGWDGIDRRIDGSKDMGNYGGNCAGIHSGKVGKESGISYILSPARFIYYATIGGRLGGC